MSKTYYAFTRPKPVEVKEDKVEAADKTKKELKDQPASNF